MSDSPHPDRSRHRGRAANEIFAAFPRRVLPFDLAAATAYADVVAGRERDGNPISGFGAQIAGICRSQAATLATRNTEAFTDTGITLIDPWQEPATQHDGPPAPALGSAKSSTRQVTFPASATSCPVRP